MIEEKELSTEEQKAKEYVDFYYFWLFHYCSRNYENELKNHLPPLTASNFSEAYSQRHQLAQTIYYGHPLSSMYPHFLNDDYTDVDDLFDGDCVPFEHPTHLLEKLYDKQPISREVQRDGDYGMKVIGTSGAHLSSKGHLRGKVIAKIDLRLPNSVILYELSKLRETKFDKFPDFCDAPDLFGLQGNFLHESEIIKKTTNASFAVKDDAARAIGLWFWDTIDAHAMVETFADAWKLIVGTVPEGFILSESEDGWPFGTVSFNGVEHAYPVPSLKVLTQLGYSSSDPSVFRRIYNRTKKCIEECEVLSLK